MRAIKLIGLFLTLGCFSVADVWAKITLKSELDGVSKEGYFSLSWEGEVSENVILEMSPTSDFNSIERDYPITRDGKISLSGYGDGEFYFRLHNQSNGEKSNAVVVNVEHWPLERAVDFFFTGLALFILLIATLIISSRIKKTI